MNVQVDGSLSPGQVADPILVPGRTCWRVEQADRLACVVDAADYFRAVKAAMLQARSRIMLIGWDFDTRILFEPDGATLPGPNRLGDFLTWLVRHRRGLRIYLLKWDMGTLTDGLGRGMPPVSVLDWFTDRRIRLRADSAHPPGASHHQKIVVVDDGLAFCGGIDMTVGRWDTREHVDDRPARTGPRGEPRMPWHDATVAVDGPAARALAELARERWHRATHRRLPALAPRADAARLWPEALVPSMREVQVGVARTLPAFRDHAETREVEALYVAAIQSARTTLYVESQYLASRVIAEALAARLREASGPEIVVVVPRHAEGRLEQMAMDGARHRVLHELWQADEHGRFAAYHPVTASGNEIYVHAKILVVDDRMFRIGSSNLNNRSMGFDTECDVAVEVARESARPDEIRTGIRDLRDGLLAEHLGAGVEEFRAELEAHGGSVRKAVDALIRPPGGGRTLVLFDAKTIEGEANALGESDLMDPTRPGPRLRERVRRLLRRGPR